jgi:hypothetical protein
MARPDIIEPGVVSTITGISAAPACVAVSPCTSWQ